MIITPRFTASRFNYFTQVPGCVLYVDARDPLNTGSLPAVNTQIGTWVDKSGRGNNLVQGTSGKQPTQSYNSFNSIPGITFSPGSNQGFLSTTIPLLVTPVNGSWSIYVVVNMFNVTSNQFLIDSNGSSARFLINIQSGLIKYGSSVGAIATGKQVISMIFDADNTLLTFYINGNSIGTLAYTANGFAASLSFGIDFTAGFGPCNMAAGCELIYNWAHDTTTRNGIERRLGNIFAINAI